MSHEVESMAYFGQAPWHGLGTALAESERYDWEAASRKAGLDWSVQIVPLVTADTSHPGTTEPRARIRALHTW